MAGRQGGVVSVAALGSAEIMFMGRRIVGAGHIRVSSARSRARDIPKVRLLKACSHFGVAGGVR